MVGRMNVPHCISISLQKLSMYQISVNAKCQFFYRWHLFNLEKVLTSPGVFISAIQACKREKCFLGDFLSMNRWAIAFSDMMEAETRCNERAAWRFSRPPLLQYDPQVIQPAQSRLTAAARLAVSYILSLIHSYLFHIHFPISVT